MGDQRRCISLAGTKFAFVPSPLWPSSLASIAATLTPNKIGDTRQTRGQNRVRIRQRLLKEASRTDENSLAQTTVLLNLKYTCFYGSDRISDRLIRSQNSKSE
ncbi:hypothetical protein L1987_56678 [Smallanthus sonchifolius]|uniref:Uncharacterized protein n=1 Tax=Smallanthus sonchifolius TaxID=185202 RepID=A0ACB9EDE2_9ASTR|nr:hypothetical protein L1987_56678 [Smallanthus sonchifolius]